MVGIVWNLGAKLWDILPENVKIDSLKYLKKKTIRVFFNLLSLSEFNYTDPL